MSGFKNKGLSLQRINDHPLASQVSTDQHIIYVYSDGQPYIVDEDGNYEVLGTGAGGGAGGGGTVITGVKPATVGISKYTVTHNYDLSDYSPFVSLTTPGSGSEVSITSITNIAANTFDIILSSNPPTTGYELNWFIPTGSESVSAALSNGTQITSNGSDITDLELNGGIPVSLVPNASGVYDLGSSSFPFRELYLTNSSLYLGDKKISAVGNTLVFDSKDMAEQSAVDANTSTIGTHTTQIGTINTTVSGIETDVSGLSGAVDGKVSKSGDTITGELQITGNMIVGGDVSVAGTAYITNSETVTTSSNFVIVNDGEVGAGVTNISAGLEIDRGSEPDYQFAFLETDNTFKVGEIGDLQTVATREDTPTVDGIAVWNDATYKFDTDSVLTFDGNEVKSNALRLVGDPSVAADAFNSPLNIVGGQRAVTANETNYHIGQTTSLAQSYDIASGVTDSGYRMGLQIDNLIQGAAWPDLEGTLNTQYGMRIQYGSLSNGGSPGTITNSYGLYVEGFTTGGHTITNKYGIYQSGSAFKNVLEGALTVNGNIDGAPLIRASQGIEVDRTGGDPYVRFYESGTTRGFIYATAVGEISIRNQLLNPLATFETSLTTLPTNVNMNTGARVQGNYVPGSGAGMEMTYVGAGYITAYDRGTAQYKAMNIRGTSINLSIEGTNSLSVLNSGTVYIPTVTDSSSSTTGALTVAGGVGIAKKLYVGSSVNSNSLNVVNSESGNTHLGLNDIDNFISWKNTGKTYFRTFDSSAPTYNTICSIDSAGLQIAPGTASTSTATGALTVAGGVGVGGSLYLGGDIKLTSSPGVISMDTSDGSDNKYMRIAGGGNAGRERGGYLNVYGNEFANGSNGGKIQLIGGDVSTGDLEFVTGSASTVIARCTYSGNFQVPTAYSNTIANSANVFVNSSGTLFRSTSSARYKEDIDYHVSPKPVDMIAPATFTSKKTKNSHIGFIAEDVAQADPRLAQFDDQGRPDALDMNALVATLWSKVRELSDRVAELEGK